MIDTHSAALPSPRDATNSYPLAWLGRLCGGISIDSLQAAFTDWGTQLSGNSIAQVALIQKSGQALRQFSAMTRHAETMAGTQRVGSPQDRRFSHSGWESWPFKLLSQSFLLTQRWAHDASTGVHGVSRHHEEVVRFTLKQLTDSICPANFVATNPEVLERIAQTGGANLWQGFRNFIEDAHRQQAGDSPVGAEAWTVGDNIAVTPGKVIFRNALIELIQYAPSGDTVQAEPILIVPAWIMKYYILDLSPANSLIKYLVDQGHTVFAISWRNPDADGRDLSMDDYLNQGVMDSLDAVAAVVPGTKIHAVGYCLGGTLLSIAAAAMARDGDDRLASLSLLAAQTDFTEPGELSLFIDEGQLALLDDIMSDQGYLDAAQMAGAFQLLHSNELVWSRIKKDYLMGERTPISDLMAWNADGTRLPFKMHSEYLRRLYLNNDLADGHYQVGGAPVALSAIQCPIFCVGTQRDHVAPWRSVYKLHELADVELTFLLTSGGHNVGIVNPPGVPGRSYQVLKRAKKRRTLDPDTWLTEAPNHEGSWWPNWAEWLHAKSGASVPARSLNASRQDVMAPGTYVLQK